MIEFSAWRTELETMLAEAETAREAALTALAEAEAATRERRAVQAAVEAGFGRLAPHDAPAAPLVVRREALSDVARRAAGAEALARGRLVNAERAIADIETALRQLDIIAPRTLLAAEPAVAA